MVGDPQKRRGVIVSYSASPHFLSSPNWNQVHDALTAQLPLRNIHWKSSAKGTVNTIQELGVSLVPLAGIRDEHTSQIPITLLEKPLLHIYFVPCEDSELETYRTLTRKQIKDWHGSITSKRHQEWLLVQIIRPDGPARAPTGAFSKLKGSVQDKMKTDFNSDKRDRCVQVKWSNGAENPLVWAELVNRMKDGILAAFDAAVAQRQEEIRRSESQQQMPGWNFCTFFILKQSLAASYEGIELYEEALQQYNELEASFHHVWRERSMSWFGTFIEAGPKDDSMPLLLTTKKPYRDLILANTISVFDFRIYLLACQCELLAKSLRYYDLTIKVVIFLGSVGRRLRSTDNNLPLFFVESWIYSSASSAIEQCENWVSSANLDASQLAALNAGKGELLDLARNQLDIIGLRLNYLPACPPFFPGVTSRECNISISDKFTTTISNDELLVAIKDSESFYDYYIATTNRAIAMYTISGRRKFALRLHGTLAALDLHRGRLDAALATYNSLPAHYAQHMWSSLEAHMLSRALDTFEISQKPRDITWIKILLLFFKACVEQRGTELIRHDNRPIVNYMTSLMNELRSAVSQLDTDLIHAENPFITIRVLNHLQLSEERDGVYLDVVVQNHLSCPIPIDQLRVFLIDHNSEKVSFSTELQELAPGKTKLKVFCMTSSPGIYRLGSTEAHMSRLIFEWSYKVIAPKASYALGHRAPMLVTIPHDPLALDVQIAQSDCIELGNSPSLQVVLTSGRNYVPKITLILSSPEVVFYCKDAKLKDELDDEVIKISECTESSITITNIQPDSKVVLEIPHSGSSSFQVLKVFFTLEYNTGDEPSITRCICMSRSVVTALPIAVNVEDFFRGTKLISKFSVSSTTHQHVRIGEVSLNPPNGGIKGLSITPCVPSRTQGVTVTPAQPANFLFAIDCDYGPVHESLTLIVKFRMLREEVQTLIQDKIEKVLENIAPTVCAKDRIALMANLVAALESDGSWVPLYEVTGKLLVPHLPSRDEHLSELLRDVHKLLQAHTFSENQAGKWRELQIPVDIPYVNIVVAARIRMVSTALMKDYPADSLMLPIYAGQPISATATIQTFFHWSFHENEKEKPDRYEMQYNIEESSRDWIISGPKRGDFTAFDDGIHTIHITMIALHHGECALPNISVTAHPLTRSMTMGCLAIPSIENYQVHGAERVMVLPRGERRTFVAQMGTGDGS